jgi:6-pyruvoyltetrahydropterin/6-carboxytetrahydropterin synthase
MDYMFDHTVLVAEDDPMRMQFEMMHNDQPRGKQYNGPMQIRIVPATGAEKFAEFIYNKLNKFVKEETNNRVRVQKVEFREHNKNSAIYSPTYV